MTTRSCNADESANKRELVNKFANCIGDGMGHLVLSGPIFAQELMQMRIIFKYKSHYAKQTDVSTGETYNDIDVRAPFEQLVINKVGDSKQ